MGYRRGMRFLGVLSLLMTSLQAFQGKLESYGMDLSVAFRPACNISHFRAVFRRKEQSALQYRRSSLRLKYCTGFILRRTRKSANILFERLCVIKIFNLSL